MTSHARRPLTRGLAFMITLLVALAASAGAALADTAAAGGVRFAKAAESSFDAYTKAPTAAQQTFMRAHYWRMRTYAPYFDSRLSWYSNAWAYQDAYALYPSAPEATTHPDWILHDQSGNKLWIQFACSDGKCTQYAADVGNPAYRSWWISTAKAKLAAGYRGLFIDDVNMAERISNGNGTFTAPVDPRTGKTMDEATWQHYMAQFMQQVRAALPGVEIVHNAIWTVGDGNADLRAELGAADYIEVERGFNDSGIVGGSSKFGFDTLAGFIDRRHAAGQGVVLDARATTPAGRLYGLATYFLLSNGNDALGNDMYSTPDGWWAGYDVQLGAPLGPRYQAGGVWRRDFQRGVVLVNEPGAPTRGVPVGGGLHDADGKAMSSVTLAGGAGEVLVGAAPAPATPAPAAPKPTATTVAAKPAAAPAPAKAKTQRAHTTTTARAKAVRVYGKVRGARSGGVRIAVQRRHGRHWRTVKSLRTAVVASGRYVHRLPRLSHGSYRVRASFVGSSAARPSRSPFRRFRV